MLSGLESPFHLILIVLALLLLFGAKRLPEMGRSLGRGLREFKDSVSGVEEPAAGPPPPPSELAASPETQPVAVSSPAAARSALESLSEEDRRAVIASLSEEPESKASGQDVAGR